ncbi:MAG: hypothetical protein NTZ46_06625 [Verrucomicrobia bacterium]|nr:hypothetical protein [Verrucomicrobiota bacterium]
MKRKKIVVMGFTAGCPIAGVIWQHVHYIVGLQRLGHEVYYIEDSARLPYNPVTWTMDEDYSYAAEVLGKLAAQFGFEGRWGYCARFLPDHPCAGLQKKEILELYRDADAILNVCGSQEFNEDLLGNDRMLYVESDPGVEQIKIDKGVQDTLDYLGKHRALFTFGENIGNPDFPVPIHGQRWLPTRQPVVTDLWKTSDAPSAAAVFTSIANWNTSGKKDIEWRKENYLWSKSLEFLKFVDAPRCSGEPFELATDIKDQATNSLFHRNNWRLSSPHELSIHWNQYLRYIQDSKGEFTVAKDQYVRLNTGWFSDRSACYLAAGRPVITQETGFTKFYGGKEGLFSFLTMEEIVEAVRAINADYGRHSRAAFAVAQEFFEAEKVLGDLLKRAGI